ncbi:glycosyltransferase family 2 protein [Flavobacterium sp.]|uniref:glycosyltransferase family 2 protein n=1 Tax=Flavobacterium sp. TaxID=239 RepID=UPI0039E3EEB1
MMKIAVVILNWNGSDLLRKFLPSVVQFSLDADIYVADNASTDNSIAVLETDFPSVKIIHNERNFGFATGYNQALKKVDADIFVLLNSDVEVTQNWLKPIIAEFENNPNTAIIQPKILDQKNKEYFEYAGAAGGFIDQYGYPFCRGRLFDTIEKDQKQYQDDCEIFWASGACLFIRASVYNELGGLDDDFFAHQEEIDLCWRAFNAGYQAKYVAHSTVYHVGGATLQQGNPRKTYLNFRNSLYMLLKNLPASKLLPVIFLRLVLDGIAGIQFILQGKITHCMAIVNAHFSFYGAFSKNFKKRKGPQSSKYYKVNSIVYKYFWQKRRNFTELF